MRILRNRHQLMVDERAHNVGAFGRCATCDSPNVFWDNGSLVCRACGAGCPTLERYHERLQGALHEVSQLMEVGRIMGGAAQEIGPRDSVTMLIVSAGVSGAWGDLLAADAELEEAKRAV